LKAALEVEGKLLGTKGFTLEFNTLLASTGAVMFGTVTLEEKGIPVLVGTKGFVSTKTGVFIAVGLNSATDAVI
jgi:hypothetical protein